MGLNVLGSLLESIPEYQRLEHSLAKPHARASVQVLASATPFTLSTLLRRLKVPTLVLAPQSEDSRWLYEQLVAWNGTERAVWHFPETETLPFERLASDQVTVHQRLSALAALTSGESSPLVVASVAAVAQKTITRDALISTRHCIRMHEQVTLDDLLDRWRQMGYHFESTVYAPGSVSRRGGILDIYPIGATLPARIELWGNEVDSIRHFDPATQRSTDIVDSVDVIPAHETLPALADRTRLDDVVGKIDSSNCTEASRQRVEQELELLLDGHEVEELDFYSGLFNHGSLLDYFPRDGLLSVLRPSEVAEAAGEADERAGELRRVKEQRGELPLHFPSPHLTWNSIEAEMADVERRLDVMPWGAAELTHRSVFVLPFTSAPAFLGKLDSFVGEAVERAEEHNRVVAVTSHAGRLHEILSEHGVAADLPESLKQTPSSGSITVLQSEGTGVGDGFVLASGGERLAVFGDTEIFGVTKQRRGVRRTPPRRDAFMEGLSPGDYVVHVEHGIGRFTGTGQISGDKAGAEYLVLQYAQGDKLYVPLEHLDRVTSYIAPLDHPPALTRLGTQEWKRAKERAERSTREMAAELLSLYAARELGKGHAFAQDTSWQGELEASFPYEETPDQLATAAQVKADMESGKPMDRLVCGDVGYGKTEIALRAAFKAVMQGKQVAVLVPTTVLAQQHYITFSQRLGAYPATVEVLSRFRSDAEQAQIVEGLSSGRIDICIGTHRLIQKDIRFKDLGLVVIDEEQRFGVSHKERLKRLRREVDVLTMTATPIPRTLHMSLAGVRDMSTMETPPEERLPIKTYVSEYSEELIREAILRELDRQGQVYFLHNRVQSIDYTAGLVSRLVPEATVGVGHGQMAEGELERTMMEFASGELDVLVCTTIIESGLDIPNVNTLIIDRADTFGLAQLYQLRGRVGRSARRAYGYLLIPGARSLSEAAEKRLKAMLAATELGAGFRIAMKDLEIRGAGNILGAEQSGHIHAVGFDLYTRLLASAVEDLRAQRAMATPTQGVEGSRLDDDPSALVAAEDGGHPVTGENLALAPGITVDLGIPASIPQEYIADLPTRLGVYQRMVKLEDVGDVAELEDELRDRFGPVTWQVHNLLYVARLKLKAKAAEIESIARDEERIVLRLRDEVGGARRALQKLFAPGVEVGNEQIRLDLETLGDTWQQTLVDTVDRLADFRDRLAGVAAAGAS